MAQPEVGYTRVEPHMDSLKNSAISNFDFGQRDCFDFAGSFLPFPFYKVSSFIFSWLVSKLRPIWGKQDNEKGNVVIMANRWREELGERTKQAKKFYSKPLLWSQKNFFSYKEAADTMMTLKK